MIYLETQLRVRVRLDKAGSLLSIRHTGSQKVVLHPAPLRPSGCPWSANSASFLSNNNICSFTSQFLCQMQSWAENRFGFFMFLVGTWTRHFVSLGFTFYICANQGLGPCQVWECPTWHLPCSPGSSTVNRGPWLLRGGWKLWMLPFELWCWIMLVISKPYYLTP